MKRALLALVVLAALLAIARRDAAHQPRVREALERSPVAHAASSSASVAPVAPPAFEPHPLPGREQLVRATRGLDLAREALASGDPARLSLLLDYLDSPSHADLLGPDDHDALRVASACLGDDADEAREQARTFLAEVHASRLRKDVRRACFP